MSAVHDQRPSSTLGSAGRPGEAAAPGQKVVSARLPNGTETRIYRVGARGLRRLVVLERTVVEQDGQVDTRVRFIPTRRRMSVAQFVARRAQVNRLKLEGERLLRRAALLEDRGDQDTAENLRQEGHELIELGSDAHERLSDHVRNNLVARETTRVERGRATLVLSDERTTWVCCKEEDGSTRERVLRRR